MAGKQKLKFPEGFLWGAAGSPHQTEGNNISSDWWAWEHSVKRQDDLRAKGLDPKKFMSGQACDFYNRYEEDFDLAKHLNHNATRIGVEWARVEPKEGEISQEVLDHYEKILQAAQVRGLKVFLTLHHFTVPLWFLKKGGFEKKENVKYFENFARVVGKRLGEYVDFFVTINEPEIYSTHAYLLNKFPPQKQSLFVTYKVISNLIDAHNSVAPILKLETQKPVGMAYHLADYQPAGVLAMPAFSLTHYLANEYILKRTISACDFIGVNYYFHHHVGLFGFRHKSQSKHERTDLGWGIHPEGLERVLLNLKKFQKPIFITENGLADKADKKREKFIEEHLYYIHRAIEKGANVQGYLYWSLIDNFEWQEGFAPRFGLIEIDYEDFLRRKIRHSALKYAEICKNNSLEI
jgi:beta-glucosidase